MDKLYEMTGALLALQESEINEENEQAVIDTLEAVEMEFNDKSVAIVKMVQNLDKTMVSPIDDEIKRLQARKKAIQNRQDSMREYLKRNMVASGITKIDCPLFSITLRKPMKKVFIEDEKKLPDDLLNVKTSITPDKAEIARILKAGGEVDGAKLVDGEPSLLIK